MMCKAGQFLDTSVTPNKCNPCPVNSYCWKDGTVQLDITTNTAGGTTAGKCNSGYNCASGSPVLNPNVYFCSGTGCTVISPNHMTVVTTFYLCKPG